MSTGDMLGISTGVGDGMPRGRGKGQRPVDGFHCLLWGFLSFFPLLYFFNFYLFRERGKEGESEGEKLQCVVASHAPLLPTAQAWALTGNRTGNPSVHRPILNPLSHTGQGFLGAFETPPSRRRSEAPGGRLLHTGRPHPGSQPAAQRHFVGKSVQLLWSQRPRCWCRVSMSATPSCRKSAVPAQPPSCLEGRREGTRVGRRGRD